MKKITTILAAILLVAVGATAQKLSYSAVVRNSANELVANQTVTVAVSIANSETGAAVYTETHSNVQTNRNGLVTLTIGDGTVESGDLADVEWSTAYITTEYTLPGGDILTSTMPVNAVPYALYADNISPEALLGAVSAMTAEQKAALKEALGVTGGEEPTTFTCGTSKMVDGDGNEYETVQIGTQCWTKTNLRTTKDRDGNDLSDGAVSGATSLTEPYYYVPTAVQWSENNSSVSYDAATFGYYYNWEAAKLVCPAGWHLPSDAEWTTLTDYVSGQSEFQCGGNSDYIAKALASKTTDWNSSSNTCAVGNNTAANNASDFSAVPAGYCYGSSFNYAGNYAPFWSSTESSSTSAWDRNLYYNNADVYRGSNRKYDGFSVRCLRD